MKVVDLKVTPIPDLRSQTVSAISNSDDSLKDNYLNINFDNFLSFPCVIASNKIIAFSGLQYDESKWGPGIARCSSRMWIHPHYRFTGGTRFTGGPKFLNSYYCMPTQLKVARDNGLNSVFVSRLHNKMAFQEYLSLLKINTGSTFDLLSDKYWVCGGVKTIECLQFIGVSHLNEYGLANWKKYMSTHIDSSEKLHDV
jgi:hypothetical protein